MIGVAALPPRRRRLATVFGGIVLAVILVAVVVSLLGSHPSGARPAHAATRGAGAPVTAAPSRFQPVAPLVAPTPQTPVEQSVNQQLAAGLAASGSIQVAEAAPMPSPGYGDGWGRLPVAATPGGWAEQYVAGLLDIRFATQTRDALGRWVVAQSAPELLPGVPDGVQNKLAYLSLFDTRAMGGAQSPIPSATGWRQAAASGTTWHVSGLLAQTDPGWTRLVASGWQPTDQRFEAEDVSGALTVTSAHQAPVVHHFSVQLYVGSAHWHPGYGTVVVNDWKET